VVEWNVVAEDDCARPDRRNGNNGLWGLGPVTRCYFGVSPALEPHDRQEAEELVKIAVARKGRKPRFLGSNK